MTTLACVPEWNCIETSRVNISTWPDLFDAQATITSFDRTLKIPRTRPQLKPALRAREVVGMSCTWHG